MLRMVSMQGKDEIALDFAIDDTTGGEQEDALVGLSFHVPKEATGFPALDEETPSINVILDSSIVPHCMHSCTLPCTLPCTL